MPRQILRSTLAAASAGLLVTLSACSGSDAGTTGQAAGGGVAAGPSAGKASTAADAATGVAGAAIVLPEFPVPRVPDVGTLTTAATKMEASIAASDPLPGGLSVTGARCDRAGQVINRAGANVPLLGGQVTSDGGTKQVDSDGSGQVTDADSTFQVDADGSGQVTTADATLQVDADGSGQYTDATTTYQVDADGSGQYSTATETYQVDTDGSGQWSWPGGSVTNDGAGAGTWTSPDGVLVVNGDGTGTMNGAAVTVPAMPDFVVLGQLPKLQTLRPLGRACGTLIRIDASVLFDFDKAEIRPRAAPVLTAIAKALTGTRSTVDVDGYTDAKGSDAYNLDLSKRRAAAVVTALTSAGATTPLRPHGYGEARPIARNAINGKDNPVGRQLNRRVELVIRSS